MQTVLNRDQDIVKFGKPLQRLPEQRLGEAKLFRGAGGVMEEEWPKDAGPHRAECMDSRDTKGPPAQGPETMRAPCSPH